MNLNDLKPCPFCGGEARTDKMRRGYLESGWVYFTSCQICNARGSFQPKRKLSIQKWNIRTNEDAS